MNKLVITKYKNIFKKLFGFLHYNVWRLEGKGKDSDVTLTIYYFGIEVEKNYIRQLWFKNVIVEEYLGVKHVWQLYNIIKKVKTQCTLVIIESNSLLHKLFKKKNDFYIPQWVNGIINLPLDISNDSANSDCRRIHNNNLSYLVTDRKQDFDDFYHTMYKPYIALRFEEQSIAISYNTIQRMIATQKCKLLIVKQNDVLLGSILIILYKNQPPFIWLLGIKNADFEYLKLGTTGALYYFSAEYLGSLGYKKMFVGASRPFLDDGILKYKKKWGLHIISHSYTGFLLKPGQYSDTLSTMMQKFPFIAVENKKMYGTVFVNGLPDNKESLIQKTQKDYMTKGLHGIRFYNVSPDKQKIEQLFTI